MSEIWSAPCRECDMEGIVTDMKKATNGIPGECLYKTCPTCKGAKEVVLVVECCNGPKINGKQACGVCEDYSCTDGYRPLTVSEVEEMCIQFKGQVGADNTIEEMVKCIEILKPVGGLVFKGHPVKVKPCVIK